MIVTTMIFKKCPKLKSSSPRTSSPSRKKVNQHEDDEEAMKRQKKALNPMKFLLPDILPSHHYN